MSLTLSDDQEVFLVRQIWEAGQYLKLDLLQQKIYCQTENFSVMLLSGICIYLSMYVCFSLTPLFYVSLVDYNSVNDFDLPGTKDRNHRGRGERWREMRGE